MKKLIILLFVPFAIGAHNAEVKFVNDVSYHLVDEVVKPSKSAKKAAKKLIESYRTRVLNGESMSDLAIKYSDDPGSSENGGRYDDITRGMMVPEFEKVAFSLNPNEISKVFETVYGYHFVQCIEIKGDVIAVRHILVVPK